jgi:hypothetical protein
MPTCSQCGSPLESMLAPYVAGTQICSQEGVDVVYTYASDEETAYTNERARHYDNLGYLEKLSIDTDDAVATQRARAPLMSWLFRMSLRSLAANAPWVRNVYVVTDTVPKWLNRSTVHVVHTSEIMSQDHLPTFNSHAVEANLHKIPGLSECYLYLNADYFIGRGTTLDDFIDPRKGQYKFYLETDRVTASAGAFGRPPAAHDAAFKNANVLLDRWNDGKAIER